jgi:hypothetical protein
VSAAVGFEEEHDFIMGPGFDHYSHVAIQLWDFSTFYYHNEICS